MGFKVNVIFVINRKVIKKLCLAILVLKSYRNDFCLEVLLEPLILHNLLEFGGGFRVCLFVCLLFFPLSQEY